MEDINNDKDLRNGMFIEAKKIKTDSNYSARRHFNTAAWFKNIHYITGILATSLSAIAGTSIYFSHNISFGISGFTALVSAVLIGSVTILGPGEHSNQNYYAGSDYLKLYKRVDYFINIDMNTLTTEEIKQKLAKFRKTISRLDSKYTTLWTPRLAYLKAKKDIYNGSTDYED